MDTGTLPHELRIRLLALLRSAPSDSCFERLLAALVELGDSPHAARATAMVASGISHWADHHRHARWKSSLSPRVIPLIRALSINLDELLQHAPSFAGVRELRLTSFELAYETAAPDVLEKLPALRSLSLAVGYAPPDSATFKAVSRLRLPSRLERLTLRHDYQSYSGWNEVGLRALASRLTTECPALTQLEVGAGPLAPLAELPERVEVSVFDVSHRGDASRVGSALPARPLGTLALTGKTEEVLATELPSNVARLRFGAEPGELEALLKRPWPRLTALTVTLPAQHARMHRKKPPDYSFTRGDVEALAASGFLSQLESLELTGILGGELAQVLVAALARANPPLTRLTLNAGEIGNDALQALVDSGLLTRVRHLELFRCGLKAKGIAVLLGDKGPKQLSTLVLAKNAANQQALEGLSAWPGLSSLSRLDLREVTLSPAQRASLEASPHLQPWALDLSDRSFW